MSKKLVACFSARGIKGRMKNEHSDRDGAYRRMLDELLSHDTAPDYRDRLVRFFTEA
jgi:hypothetical protein